MNEKRLGKDVAIFRHGNIFDVFFGKEGWNRHARFNSRRTAKGVFITQVSGESVPAYIFKQIIEEVNKP